MHTPDGSYHFLTQESPPAHLDAPYPNGIPQLVLSLTLPLKIG